MTRAALSDLLAGQSLRIAGVVEREGETLVLVGPDNRTFWSMLMDAQEGQDGAADPIDRWSRRVLTALGETVGAEAIFPFGGPPWHPFIGWALDSGEITQSPIGLLVSDETGLWVSFRGAFRFEGARGWTRHGTPPCPTCAAPCTTACPVDAFADGQYDVAACRAHVNAPEGIACREGGCLARHACPVGRSFAPPPDQATHHMAAFRGE